MSDTEWEIAGREFLSCNCDYGCPCQFKGRPTHGNCRIVLGVDIETGHHGRVSLDGLRIAAIFAWPGAIHEGHGEVLTIIDERASPEQRDALLRIMSGQDTDPGATFFQALSATYKTVHDPVFAEIDLEVAVDARTARLKVPGMIDGRGEPIKNPVMGEAHRARINLPQGLEYTVAEVGRGWTKTEGSITHDMQDSHAHFAALHMTGAGIVR